MSKPDPKRIAQMKMASRSKTAGEVRFIKDKSNDATQWAWQDSGPQERRIAPDYAFSPRKVKQLAKVLRATTASMGHAMSAYNTFSKLKSADVSPDGSLGGKGYIQKIAEMRRAYMNVVEALSALSDTIYDEVNAPHWAAISRQETDSERAEVEQIVQDAENIKEDPEAWAKEEEAEMDEAHGKTARRKTARKIAAELSDQVLAIMQEQQREFDKGRSKDNTLSQREARMLWAWGLDVPGHEVNGAFDTLMKKGLIEESAGPGIRFVLTGKGKRARVSVKPPRRKASKLADRYLERRSASRIPTSVRDWQLYDIKGAGVAAKDLTRGIKKAISEFQKWSKKNPGLDPQWSDRDLDKVNSILSSVYYKHFDPIMDKHSEFGAADTEPRNVGISTLGSAAAAEYGGKEWEYSEWY